MNITKAIEEFERYLNSDCYLDAPSNEACNLALAALYKQETAPEEHKNGSHRLKSRHMNVHILECPNPCCKHILYDSISQGEVYDYCPKCGYKIDWRPEYSEKKDSKISQNRYYKFFDGWFTYYINEATGKMKYELDQGDIEVQH